MAAREKLEVDVLIVGAGPAGLACAIHLHDQFLGRGAAPPHILLIEKGFAAGAHSLSGAVLDPRALDELIPNWQQRGAPVARKVNHEEVLFLTARHKIPIPGLFVPAALRNTGNYIVSLGELAAWLAHEAGRRGIEILTGVAGAELLAAENGIGGVRCGDTGAGRDGAARPQFQPGAEIRAKATVLAEGARGSLAKTLLARAGLEINRRPQVYALGIKELWEIPAGSFPAGKVAHTLGFPLAPSLSSGGGFLYGLDETHVALGLAVYLHDTESMPDPHTLFNRWKTHPYLRAILEKGRLAGYGAKLIPEGGYYSLPRFYGDGFCIIGDSAGFLNPARLKGVHLALHSGMLAAKAIAKAFWANDFSLKQLGNFEDLFQRSWAKEELSIVNSPPPPRLFKGRKTAFRPPLERGAKPCFPTDGKLTFDKAADIFYSGAQQAEDQPCHLKIQNPELCAQHCSREYGNPCQYFCPAGVYEWLKAERRLQLSPANCLHCKTCEVLDPYRNIVWTVPEGGGPRYRKM